MTMHERASGERWPVGWIVALVAVVLLLRAIGFVPAVINPDESVFALAAREVVHGHLPYVTLFDNKPVGSTLILAAAFRLLGQGIAVLRLVGALCVVLSAAGIAALVARGGFSRTQGAWSALLYVAFTCLVGGLATLTEILLAPFTILAVLLLYRQLVCAPALLQRFVLAAAAGLACGGAVAIKLVPIVPGGGVAVFVFALLAWRRAIGVGAAAALLATFAIGSLVPMLLAAGVYVSAGQLDAFLYSNFGFARSYAAIHPGIGLIAQRLGTMIDAFWPLLALAALSVAVLLGEWRRGRRAHDLQLLALVWLGGEVAAASASLQFFPHYFLVAVPPLVVLSAFAIRSIGTWLGAQHRPQAFALLAGIVALIAVERAEVDTARDIGAGKDASRRVAAAIERDRGPRPATLYVINYQLTALYGLTGAPLPPTRFAVPAHLLSKQSAMARVDPAAEVARVLASCPDYLVTADADHLPGWAAAMLAAAEARDYRPIYAQDGVRVFRSTRLGAPVPFKVAANMPTPFIG